MPFEIIATASRPGDRVNEDAFGHSESGDRIFSEQAAWVLDGATGVAEREYVPVGPTDAAWLARTLNEEMAALDTFRFASRRYFARVIESVEARYRALVPDYKKLPRHARPSAAVVWLRANPGWIEFRHQGDCVAVVEQGTTVKVLGTIDRTGSDDTLEESIAARRAAGPSDGKLLEAMGDELRRRRDRLNRPNGYWMLGIDRRSAAAMEFAIFRALPGTRILLCSDGYWRLVDHFRRYDAAGLLQASFERGPDALLDELRALEAADPECAAFPRIKPMDDATALILRF
jgi:hypothetical protein